MNTFTDYEPFTGTPPTVLLLNELLGLPSFDEDPLYHRMLEIVTVRDVYSDQVGMSIIPAEKIVLPAK
ncbi:MAG: hypothetical protein M3O31_14510 [Acidobacteriota bacterium]|nr:hypothetical protein [Acidobacteriota bacterium]